MKLLINDKYEDVGILSFMKCAIISQLLFMAMFWSVVLIITMIFFALAPHI